MLKVAYLINQYPKVSHSFVRREIRALEGLGLEVLRLASRGWDDASPDVADRYERERTRYALQGGALPLVRAVLCSALTSPRALLRAVGLAWRCSRGSDRPLAVHLIYLAQACLMLRWIREAGAQHVHAHFGTNPAELALLIHALGGPGYSFTVHGPEEFDRANSLHLGLKMSRARFTVAISSYGRSQLFRWLSHRHWPRVEVVRCGIDSGFRDAAPVPTDGPARLVCVGRLCEQKGQMLLVQAFARVLQSGRQASLVLAGDGEMRPEIEALVARLGIAAHVRITGWISGQAVREEILASRALVLASFAEGLPVVIMEALALRRPVLSTYVAGIPELVQPGRNGWLVPAGDIDALTATLHDCLSADVATLRAMGEAGRSQVLERHDVEREATRLHSLFRAWGVPAVRPGTSSSLRERHLPEPER